MVIQLNPHISVDIVVFGFDDNQLKVLLINDHYTKNGKQKHLIKLPGNLIMRKEPLARSAERILTELTGLRNIYLNQFGVFDDPARLHPPESLEWLQDTTSLPIDRVVTISYYSLIKINSGSNNLSLSPEAEWFPINEVPELIFDHNQIVEAGLDILRKEFLTEPLCFELLPEKFMLNQLQKIYEIILGFELDNRNFRKRINRLEYIIPLNERQTGVAHKPARLYKFDKQKYNDLEKQHTGFVV
ncbi:MAG: NUDIX hydrolase [Bacteroidales bacterium]|nr:NUDIX hydrolase [Bacteroidales bacterium]